MDVHDGETDIWKTTTNDLIKKEWNKLPIDLRIEKSLSRFKSSLKAHFYIQAFGISDDVLISTPTTLT